MKTIRICGFIALEALMVLALCVVSASAGDFLQNVGQGTINWTTGVIQAKGIGAPPKRFYGKPNARPMALRAAKVVALRNILEAVNGVRVDSTTVIKDFAVDSDVIRSQVQGIVKGAREVDRQYMSDGTVEVTMAISMHGDLSQVILPKSVGTIPIVAGKPAGNAPATSATYTGLVIDARGLGVRPAMAPKVVDESGQEVYGSAKVSREYAIKQGMTGYAKDLSSAEDNPRVTNHPVVVKGLRTDGPGNCNVVISNTDAAMLRGAADTQSFLQKCRVMIVVD